MFRFRKEWSKTMTIRANIVAIATLAVLAVVIATLATGGFTAEAQGQPGTINNLSLTSTSAGWLTITWDTPDPAPADYRLSWAEQSLDFLSHSASNEAGRGNEYPDGQDTSITLTGLIKGETFKVQIRTRYTSGGENDEPWSGPWTTAVTQRVKGDPPAAPTGLSTSQVTHDSVTLSWTAPDSDTITGYRVLRGDDANSLSATVADTGTTNPQFTDQNVVAETIYVYAVQALSPDGASTQSQTATAITAAPPTPTAEPTVEPTTEPPPASDEVTGLALSSDAVGDLVITWNTPTDEPTDYRVSWGPADEEHRPYTEEDTSRRGNSYPGGDVTALTLTGLPGGVNYKVIVRARYHDDQTGQDRSGPWTDEATQRVKNDAPDAPTGLSATETTSKGQTFVALLWTAPSHDALTGYRIWRGATANSLTVLAQDTGDAATGYNDATTETGNAYVYAVAALSLDGNSPRSATASVTRAAITTRDDPPEDDEEDLQFSEQQGGFEAIPAVSNIGNLSSTGTVSAASDGSAYATSFTTGSDPGGYTLSGARLNVSAPTGVVFTVAIYNDSSDNPGTIERTLTHPATVDTDTATTEEFTAAATLTLAASTKYWVVIARVSGDGSLTAAHATSTTPDSGGLPNWSIGATRTRATAMGSWGTLASNMAIGVLADVAVPRLTNVAITSKPLDGDTYKAGENIEVEFTFNTDVEYKGGVAAIRVGDTMSTNYRSAEYMGGSGTSKLLYRYEVGSRAGSADTDTTGIAVDGDALGSADTDRIIDRYGNAATLTTPGLNTDSNHKVTDSTVGCEYVLCIDVTAADLESGPVVGAIYYPSGPEGSLSNRSFKLGGQKFVVTELLVRNGNQLEILLNSEPTPDLLAQGTLHIGTTTFHHFHEGTVDGNRVTWSFSGLRWRAGNEIRVTLQDDILVSNLGKTASLAALNTSATTTKYAQKFTTGSYANGYSIGAVDLGSEVASGTVVKVSINRDVSGAPGESLYELTNPSDLNTGDVTDNERFTAPDDAFLQASKSYWLVWERVSGSGVASTSFTTDNGEDNGAAVGWSIADSVQEFSGSTWSVYTSSGENPIMQLAISGAESRNIEATGTILITGVLEQGRKLTADTGGIVDPQGFDASTVSYQWLRVDGGVDSPISSANNQTYTIQPADVGKLLKVRVSLSDLAGNTESVTSNATKVVQPSSQVITDNTAVSNLSQGGTSDLSAGASDLVAQSFLTGSFSFELRKVRLALSPDSGATLQVSIYSNNSNSDAPDTSQHVLTNPVSFSTSIQVFTSSGYTLAANTRYWVVVEETGGSAGFDYSVTSSDRQTRKARGWSIGDRAFFSDMGGSFAQLSSDHNVRMEIFADPIPQVLGVKITSTPLDGDTYKAGENLEVEYSFSVPVTYVKGVAAIWLGEGAGQYRSAGYVGGSGTQKLLYRYRVKSGDTDDNGVLVQGNALGETDVGQFTAVGGGSVIVTHSSIPEDTSHKVDGSQVGCGQVLCTDVAVASQGGGKYGAVYDSTLAESSGSLSNRSFNYGGSNYVIQKLLVRNPGQLELLLDRAPQQSLLDEGTLHIGGKFYHFNDASLSSDNGLTWGDSGLSWSVDDEVRVTLRDNILVSNTGQADSTANPAITSTLDRLALQFTTGNEANGYKIDAVNLGIRIATRGSGAVVRVAIYSDNSDSTGTSKHVLTNPATIDDNLRTFEKFTATDVVLNSSTKYWLVVQRISGTSGVDFNSTASTAQDATTGPGWDLGSSTWTTNTNGDWSALTALGTIIMKVSIEGKESNITSPAFTKSAETLSVNENASPGTIVGTVSANDPDDDTLTLSVSGTDATAFAEVFSLDTGTGAIRVKTGATVDYETKASYSITIRVTDGEDITGATETPSSIDDTVAVTITVTDVEETGTVALSRQTPRVDIQVTASLTDPDGGVNAVTWQWSKSDTAAGTFNDITGATDVSYTPVSGDLNKYLKASASYTDRRGPGKSGESTPAQVMAALFTPPAFPDADDPKDGADPIALAIDENSAAGTNVGTVRATDEDDDPLTHSVGGSDSLIFASTFDYDTSTGAITLQTGAAVDHETKASYSITVSVTDGEDATGVAETPATTDDTVVVTINVTNIEEPGSVSLPTSQPQLGVSLTPTLTDPDGGITGQTWQWSRGDTAGGPFTNISGAASASYTPVQADVGKYLNVRVTYTDAQGSGKSADKTADNAVVAIVTNQAPSFSADMRALSVAENAAANAVVGTVSATDPNSDTLTYSVSGMDLAAFNEDFTLNTSTGQVRVKSGATIDFESRPSYTVTVGVTDSKDPYGNASSAIDATIPVTINVTNREEAGTVTLSTLRPLLNLPLSATLTDPDGGVSGQIWQWARGDSATGSFSNISGATSPSYTPVQADVGKYLKVRVTYTDELGSGRSAEAVFANPVIDAPLENVAPVFPSNSYTRSVAENVPVEHGLGAPITATDANMDSLTYHLRGADASAFTIALDTGQLRTGRSLDFEGKSEYEVSIAARDPDGLTATTTVTVTVTNLEEAGALMMRPGRPLLYDNIRLTLTDQDGGVTGESWQWSRGDSAAGPFTTISGATGLQYRTTDSDNGKYVRARVSYTDALGPSKSAETVTEGPAIPDKFAYVVKFYPWKDAGDLPVGGSATGYIQGGVDAEGDEIRDEVDYFELTGLTSGETYQITLVSRDAESYHFTGVSYYGPASHLHHETMGDFQSSGYSPGRRHILFTVDSTYWRFFIGVKGHSSANHEYTVRLFKPAADDYSESASGAAADASFGSGKIERLYDVDWHKTVDLMGSQQYLVTLSGAGSDPLYDPVIHGIYDLSGNLIPDTSDTSSGLGKSSALLFTPEGPGSYHVAVRGNVRPYVASGAPDPTGRGHTGSYRLTVSIPDNDDGTTMVAVSFGAVSYTAAEGGSDATVTVSLSEAPGRVVTVPVTVIANGGAAVGDYSGAPSSVTFGAEETSKAFDITATDDDDNDDGESLTMGFGSPLPDGVTVGSPATTTVILADNERAPASASLYAAAREASLGCQIWPVEENGATVYRTNVDTATRRAICVPSEVLYVDTSGCVGVPQYKPLGRRFYTFEIRSDRTIVYAVSHDTSDRPASPTPYFWNAETGDQNDLRSLSSSFMVPYFVVKNAEQYGSNSKAITIRHYTSLDGDTTEVTVTYNNMTEAVTVTPSDPGVQIGEKNHLVLLMNRVLDVVGDTFTPANSVDTKSTYSMIQDIPDGEFLINPITYCSNITEDSPDFS